jgi:hypothetical protein
MPTPIIIPEGIRAGINTGATTIARAVAVRRGLDDAISLPAAVDDPVWGVTMAPIPIGTYGDVQLRGVAIITAGAGGFQDGQRLMVEPNTGKAIPFAAPANANASLLGIAVTTTPADGLGGIELAGPAASRHA